MTKNINLTNHHEKLKKLSHELDHNFGGLNLNRETLKRLNIQLGIIGEDIENTDQNDLTSMGLTFRDISHTVQLLADLLHYTLEDLDENLQQTEMIKSDIFNIVVKENGGKANDE